jgi:hypothetical protein
VISRKQKHGLLLIHRCRKVYGGIPIVSMWDSGLYAKLIVSWKNKMSILTGIICRILTEENLLEKQRLQDSE